jgi:hypothetical protein
MRMLNFEKDRKKMKKKKEKLRRHTPKVLGLRQ